MKITLERLTLRNFKGIRDLTANFGQKTGVFGDNATGKTTLFDAFTWHLFDKDSSNRKDFEIKTLNADGTPIHHLDHEVEGKLLVDGRPVTFRKVYSEKWTKQRGKAEREFTGHTTDYFIDSVPVKLKDYKERIDSLIDENVFKLLTSPTYFNEQFSWQDRRRTLLKVCGDVSDSDVIASSSALDKLPAILDGRTIDDHRKVIASRRAEINKELDKLPVRIDEAERSKPDTDVLSESILQSEIEQLQFEVQSKESEVTRLQNGGEIAEQQKQLASLEGELLEIKNSITAGSQDNVSVQRAKVSELLSRIQKVESDIKRSRSDLELAQERLELQKESLVKCRDEWVEVNSQEMADPHVNDTCVACGQGLPADQVQSAHDKAIADFNRRKAQQLEEISSRGSKTKEMVVKLEAECATLNNSIDKQSTELEELHVAYENAGQVLERLQSEIKDPASDPSYVSKQSEIEKVKNKIAALRQSVLDDVQRIRTELMDLRDELRRKESLLARFEQVRTLEKRIDELKKQERSLAAEFERLEEELYLTEEFTRAKVALLEERINSKFRYARFKLFDTQVNGGLTETCETTYDGVPYGSLNNAARINVGLDIINTLSEHYGITAPIFIDNAEGITRLIDTSSQLIMLIVPLPFDRLPQSVQVHLIALHGNREAADNAWHEQNQHLRVVTDSQEIKEVDVT